MRYLFFLFFFSSVFPFVWGKSTHNSSLHVAQEFNLPTLKKVNYVDSIERNISLQLRRFWNKNGILKTDAFLQSFFEKKRELGIPNLFSVSILLTKEANQERKKGNKLHAELLYKEAIRFSFDSAEPRFRLFLLSLTNNPFDFSKNILLFENFLDVFRKSILSWKSFEHNTLWLFFVSLLLFLSIFWVIGLVSSIGGISQFLSAKLPKGSHTLHLLFCILFLFFLPFLGNWKVIETCFFLSFFCFFFQRFAFQMVSFLWVFFLFFLPLFVEKNWDSNPSPNSELFQMLSFSQGAFPEKKLLFVKQKAKSKKQEMRFLSFWSLGLFYKRKGELLEAMNWFEKALLIEKNNARILNNLAMLHGLQKDGAKAHLLFLQAQKEDPTLEEVLFNSFLIEKNLSMEHQLRQFQTNSQKVSFFRKHNQNQWNQFFMESTIPEHRFHFLKTKKRSKDSYFSVVWIYLSSVSERFYVQYACIVFLLFFLFGIVQKFLWAGNKKMLFHSKTEEKLLQEYWETRKRRVTSFLSIFITGIYDISFFRFGRGSFFLFGWCFGVSFYLLLPYFSRSLHHFQPLVWNESLFFFCVCVLVVMHLFQFIGGKSKK